MSDDFTCGCYNDQNNCVLLVQFYNSHHNIENILKI